MIFWTRKANCKCSQLHLYVGIVFQIPDTKFIGGLGDLSRRAVVRVDKVLHFPSISEALKWMILFSCWNAFFALQYFILLKLLLWSLYYAINLLLILRYKLFNSFEFLQCFLFAVSSSCSSGGSGVSYRDCAGWHVNGIISLSAATTRLGRF